MSRPREPLRPAREVALDLAVVTGVHEDSAAARMLVDSVEQIRREAIDRAYAEGREDRDRLRDDRRAAQDALADLLGAVDAHLRQAGTPTDALRDAAGRARRYLAREAR